MDLDNLVVFWPQYTQQSFNMILIEGVWRNPSPKIVDNRYSLWQINSIVLLVALKILK